MFLVFYGVYNNFQFFQSPHSLPNIIWSQKSDLCAESLHKFTISKPTDERWLRVEKTM